MNPSPLIQDLCAKAGLTPKQAEGVVGVLLNKLRERMEPETFASVRKSFADAETWMREAPPLPPLTTGRFRLPGMEKAQLLMQMNQALKALGIPISQASTLGRTLQDAVRKHHPDLEDLIRPLL